METARSTSLASEQMRFLQSVQRDKTFHSQKMFGSAGREPDESLTDGRLREPPVGRSPAWVRRKHPDDPHDGRINKHHNNS